MSDVLFWLAANAIPQALLMASVISIVGVVVGIVIGRR
jgi:hypothetical protein